MSIPIQTRMRGGDTAETWPAIFFKFNFNFKFNLNLVAVYEDT